MSTSSLAVAPDPFAPFDPFPTCTLHGGTIPVAEPETLTQTSIPSADGAPFSPPQPSGVAAQPLTEPTDEQLAALEVELADERRQALGYLRRALLAEHAGTLVPDLVVGDTADMLLASVDVARAAYAAAREAALAELRQQTPSPPPTAPMVPAGTPARDGLDSLAQSPLQRIAAGLRR